MGYALVIQGAGKYSVAIDYLVSLIDAATLHGLNVDACFSESGITPKILLRPDHQIGNVSMRIITRNILEQTELELFVCSDLNQVGIFNHGPLSIVLQSCSNLIEALRAISLFSTTRAGEYTFTHQEYNTFHSLELIKAAECANNRITIDKFIILSTLLLIAKGISHSSQKNTKSSYPPHIPQAQLF